MVRDGPTPLVGWTFGMDFALSRSVLYTPIQGFRTWRLANRTAGCKPYLSAVAEPEHGRRKNVDRIPERVTANGWSRARRVPAPRGVRPHRWPGHSLLPSHNDCGLGAAEDRTVRGTRRHAAGRADLISRSARLGGRRGGGCTARKWPWSASVSHRRCAPRWLSHSPPRGLRRLKYRGRGSRLVGPTWVKQSDPG